MPTVGLKKLHYALLTSDDSTSTAYEVPKKVADAISAAITPTTNTATLYAEDGPSETATALGEITLALNTKDLPKSVQADLLGHTVNPDGVLVRSADDEAPYVAIGFESLKSNGKRRFVWLFKGKFQPQAQNYQTKQDTPAFQTPTINAVFVRRDFDKQWQAEVDEDDETVTTAIIDNWFANVYEYTPTV